MRSKLLKLFWLNLGILSLSTAQAAVTVVPYNVPNTVVDNGDGFASVYYLDISYPGQGAPTYATHDFNGGEVFNFTIGGADAASGYLWVYAQDSTDSSIYYPVVLASCTAGAIGTAGRCDSGIATDFQIGINFAAVCAGTNGANIRGCVGASVGVAALPIKAFRLRFLSSAITAPGSTTAATGTLLQVNPQVSAPTILTNIASPGFFPGDGSILVNTDALVAQAETTTASSPSFSTVWVVAERGGTVTAGSEMSATLRQTVGYHSGEQEVTGFENSTSATQIFYEMSAGVQDSAGAIAFGTIFTQVFATDIQGFLRESNCFVATASYRDGRAPGVMLLRNFRDEVLSEFRFGRDFISWYYTYGPIAADWLLIHPVFRSVVLVLLLPLQVLAWIALHPGILVLPFLGFLLIGFLLLRERKRGACV